MKSPESLVNSRFQFLPRPAAAPGKCSCCGSVERPVVDFGLDIEIYGAVVLCVLCVGEAYNTLREHDGQYQETQAASLLNGLDTDAINEYTRTALDTVGRLATVLSTLNLDATSNLQDAEESLGSNDESVSDARNYDEAFPELIKF